MIAAWVNQFREVYTPEASALFARMSVQPDSTRKRLIDNLITSLKSNNLWTKLDAFYVFASHDSQASLLNWVAVNNCVAVNSPTFTTDRGYTGDGTTSYLNTQINPTTYPSPKFVQDNAHLGVWVNSDIVSGTMVDVGITNSNLNSHANASNVFNGPANSGTYSQSGGATTAVGHSMWTRDSATTGQYWKNGAAQSAITTTTTAIRNASMLVCASNTSNTGTVVPGSFSARLIEATHWGSNLSSTEVLAMKNSLQTYLTAIGA